LADVSFAKKSENNTAQVFGGIVYDLDSTKFEKVNSKPSATDEMVTRSSNLNRKECWKYLNGAAKEGQIVSDTLESANYKMTYQTGYSASEENFKQIGKNEISPRILHVGSHAFTFPNPFQKQNIASDFLDEELQFKTADDPMLRTGLVFAGANYFCKYGVPYRNYEDGIATAYEIRDMNLAQTELAVLSACETGLGDIHNSEGVYGLQRAFRIAGVQFIIVSLWKIPDESAKDFMRFFYGNWVANDTMSLREAFRQAREKTKALHPDPNDWAGFILIE
jgi:CHAT domain-containing protein